MNQGGLEAAIADEVLAEIARQRFTHKEIQLRSGVKQRVFGHYLIQRDRAMPFSALVAICTVLGVKPSDMVRRAEAGRVSHEEQADRAIADMSPTEAEKVRRASARVRPPRKAQEPDAGVG